MYHYNNSYVITRDGNNIFRISVINILYVINDFKPHLQCNLAMCKRFFKAYFAYLLIITYFNLVDVYNLLISLILRFYYILN